MVDFNIGKGVYIWQPGSIERGDPQKIVARLQMAGVHSAALKICDGLNVYKRLEPLIQALRDQNIRVIGWGYSYLRWFPKTEAQIVINACTRYSPDFYLIDVEHEVERNYNGAQQFMDTLRAGLPNGIFGLNSFWNLANHPLFPWKNFLG